MLPSPALYAARALPTPSVLAEWETRVDRWCADYREAWDESALLEVTLDSAVYVWDQNHERVVVAYGLSVAPTAPRDTGRIRRFPDVNIAVRAAMGNGAFEADRGHWLAHSAGGELDINLFPHRRDLNRGWSAEGKVFRRMEAEAAALPGTFVFHRGIYDDDTWIPATLEFGVLRAPAAWWIEQFTNNP